MRAYEVKVEAYAYHHIEATYRVRCNSEATAMRLAVKTFKATELKGKRIHPIYPPYVTYWMRATIVSRLQ